MFESIIGGFPGDGGHIWGVGEWAIIVRSRVFNHSTHMSSTVPSMSVRAPRFADQKRRRQRIFSVHSCLVCMQLVVVAMKSRARLYASSSVSRRS